MRNNVDYMGLAQVLRTINDIRQPSRLDLLEREYELRGIEKGLERRHDGLVEELKVHQESYDEKIKDRDHLLSGLNKIDRSIVKIIPKKRSDEDGKGPEQIKEHIFGNTITGLKRAIEHSKEEGQRVTGQINNFNTLADNVNAGGLFYTTLKHGEYGGTDDEGYSIYDTDRNRVVSTPERQAALASLLNSMEGQDIRGLKEGFWAKHNEQSIQNTQRSREMQELNIKTQKNKPTKTDKSKADDQIRVDNVVDEATNINNQMRELVSTYKGTDAMPEDAESMYSTMKDERNKLLIKLNKEPGNLEYQVLNIDDRDPDIWTQQITGIFGGKTSDKEYVENGLTKDHYENIVKHAEQTGDYEGKEFIDKGLMGWDLLEEPEKQRVLNFSQWMKAMMITGTPASMELYMQQAVEVNEAMKKHLENSKNK